MHNINIFLEEPEEEEDGEWTVVDKKNKKRVQSNKVEETKKVKEEMSRYLDEF
jgi:hypothetical protein